MKRPTEGLYWIRGSYIAHSGRWPFNRGQEYNFSDKHPYTISDGMIELGHDVIVPITWVTPSTTFHGPYLAPWSNEHEKTKSRQR